MSCPIKVGVAGWAYDDWEGIVYGDGRRRTRRRLLRVAELVDVIELNSSFYRIPEPTSAQGWISELEHAGLATSFAVKVPSVLTHAQERIEHHARLLLAGIEPLIERSRLDCLLAQFHFAFAPCAHSRNVLEAIRTALSATAPVVFELRNLGWHSGPAREFLSEQGFDLADIDMPGSGPEDQLILSGAGERAYLRLHGRNRSAWYRRGRTRDQAYDYLYSRDELQRWITWARSSSERARSVHIIANNHFSGQAMANALFLRAQLEGRKIPAPTALIERYPHLREQLTPSGGEPTQPTLF